MIDYDEKKQRKSKTLAIRLSLPVGASFPSSKTQTSLGPLGPLSTKNFPDNGQQRLIQKPVGLRHTLMNGVAAFADGNCPNTLSGKLLRNSQVVA